MIYTVTLNPSIDYAVRLDRLTPGVTHRAAGEAVTFGGKGLNVSRVLAELGLESRALGLIAGFTGEAIAEGLRREKITADFIRLREGLSRINIKLRAGEETEINGRGPQVAEDELEALLDRLAAVADGDTLILAGSAPPSLPDTVYRRILEGLAGRAVRTVVDAAGPLLLHTLPCRPFLLKPNRQELSELFGADIRSRRDAARYAGELQARGARNVLVSLGGEGALLLDETGALREMGVLPGQVVNTVGAGDSMVAGFVAGYERTRDYARALQWGCACGMATAFSEGLATREAVFALLEEL